MTSRRFRGYLKVHPRNHRNRFRFYWFPEPLEPEPLHDFKPLEFRPFLKSVTRATELDRNR